MPWPLDLALSLGWAYIGWWAHGRWHGWEARHSTTTPTTTPTADTHPQETP